LWLPYLIPLPERLQCAELNTRTDPAKKPKKGRVSRLQEKSRLVDLSGEGFFQIAAEFFLRPPATLFLLTLENLAVEEVPFVPALTLAAFFF
jgi:hypothetical protein